MAKTYGLTEQGIADLRAMYDKTQQLFEQAQRLLRSTSGGERGLNHYSAIQVRNKTGSTVPRGGVLQIKDTSAAMALCPDIRVGAPVLDGETPETAELAKTKFAIPLVPIAVNEIGPCAMQGVVTARVNIVDVDDEFCSPTDGVVSKCTSSASGLFRILEKEGVSTGEQWCTVLMQYPQVDETIPLYNTDSTTAVAGAIARITGYDVGQSAYSIAKPHSANLQPIWVIVDSAIAAGATGTGRIFQNSGLAFAYDPGEGTPAYGETWGPKPDSWLARKYFEGLFSLKDNADGGTATGIQKWSSEYIVKLKDELVQGSYIEATVLMRNNQKLVASGFNLTVYDAFMNLDETMEKDTKGIARWYGGRWLLVSAYCAPDDTEEDSAGGSPGVNSVWSYDPSLFRLQQPSSYT